MPGSRLGPTFCKDGLAHIVADLCDGFQGRFENLVHLDQVIAAVAGFLQLAFVARLDGKSLRDQFGRLRKACRWLAIAAPALAINRGDDAVVQILLNKYSSKSSVIYSRTFEKPVNWGVLSWSGILSAGTAIGCQVRTSLNGSGNWGAWSPVTTNNQDLSGLLGVTDGHRTIEVKFDLAGNGVNTPVLTSFLLLYSLSS